MARHRGERFFAFALYTTGEAGYFLPSCCTEEALVRRHGDEAPSVRWSPCDWPYHLEGRSAFKGVSRLLGRILESFAEAPDQEYFRQLDRVYGTALDVLKALDREGLFGRRSERARVVVTMLLGDLDEPQVIHWTRRLNPRAVSRRFERELKESCRRD